MHIRPSNAEMQTQAENQEEAEHGAGAWLPMTLLIAGLILLPIATYVVIVNDWAAALTGTIYTADEHQSELDAAREAGFAVGRSHGFETGFQAGEASGFEAGREAGVLDGFDAGYLAGETSGADDGFDAGHAAGYTVGVGAGYDKGQTEGYEDGLVDGYGHGFVEGCLALFESLDTDRVGSWWDYHYAPSYAYFYEPAACTTSLYLPLTLDSNG